MAIPLEDRCKAIERGLARIKEGVPAKKAWSEAALSIGANASTLYRWYQKVHGHHRADWSNALSTRYAGRQPNEIPGEAWERYVVFYRETSPPSMAETYRLTEQEARYRGWMIPLEAKFRRHLTHLGLRRSRYDRTIV
ncbi:MAG: DNA-binding domain-containing protein [Thioalkalivibrionaceae bacterium]